ncbi:MAG: hypothetical protein ABIR98_00985 [Usitatibacter sp.]
MKKTQSAAAFPLLALFSHFAAARPQMASLSRFGRSEDRRAGARRSRGLLTEAYRPEEKAKAQGANEMTIFAVQAMAALPSGVLVNAAGWQTLNYVALPLVASAGLALSWLWLRRRAAPLRTRA